MKIDFGMPSLIEVESFDDSVELCKSLGLSFIEFNMNMPQMQIDTMDIAKMERCVLNGDVYFTLHLADDISFCDFNSEVAKAHRDTAIAAIKAAKKLRIPIINLHLNLGNYVTLPDRRVYLFEQYKDLFLSRLLDFRDKCEQEIGGSGIKVCIENMEGFKDFSIEAIELLLQKDCFGLTLDVGHNFCARKIDEPFIQKRIDRLNHMHIHDAKGNSPHLAFGDGEIDIKQRLQLASEHDCRCVIETKTVEALKKSVAYLEHIL